MDRNYLQGLLYCRGKLHGREILFRPGETTAKILKRNDGAPFSLAGFILAGVAFFSFFLERRPIRPRFPVIALFVFSLLTRSPAFFPADAPARGLLELFLNGEISEACDARTKNTADRFRVGEDRINLRKVKLPVIYGYAAARDRGRVNSRRPFVAVATVRLPLDAAFGNEYVRSNVSPYGRSKRTGKYASW